MLNDVSFKIVYSILIVLSVINFAICGSLSIFEQKKYKKNTDAEGLYSLKDDVEILSIDNFKSEVYNNDRSFLVEFYNSWCGHCQRFAPSWKALATDVKEWKDLVGIGAVDCSNDANYPICREMEIMAYPTVKYFHENYKEGLGLKIQHGSDVKEHRERLLEILKQEESEGRGKIFPSLLPYSKPDLSDLFTETTNDVKYSFLILQEPSDFIGLEVAMDLHRVKELVITYAYSNNTELINLLNAIDEFPLVYAIDRDKKVQRVNVLSATREGFRASIRLFLEPKHIKVPTSEKQNIFRGKWLEAQVPDMASFVHERERQALKEKVKKMGDVVFQMDLETVLRYSLKHEVGSVKEIKGEKLEALRNYLEVLEKYFPFGKFGHLFLVGLKNYVSSHNTVSGDEITKMVQDAEKEERQVFSSAQSWLACRGSSSKYRGYPCGLWKLFHYLTVNAADHSIGLRGANHKIVLEAMHGYIKNFFGCTDCSKHFQEMAKRRDIDKVSSWDASILWLWSAHNEVNKRLSGDQTEDPEYPKQQYPSKERCPRCYDADGTWNVLEVLQYLKHVYNGINVRYIGSDTRILHLGLDGSTDLPIAGGLFRKVDESLCLILYIISFILIIGLIRIFWRRGGYKKKAYYHSLLGKV